MRRLLAALTAALVLLALVAAPLSAAPIKTPKAAMVTTVCVSGDGTMEVTTAWSDQVFDDQVGVLDVTWTFRGMKLEPSPVTQSYIPSEAGWPGTGFVVDVLPGFIGEGFIEWNRWSSIGTSTSGALSETAKTIRQPAGGWPVC